MGLVGFICPPINGESPGRANKISYCVNKCKAPCVSPHVLTAMYEMEQDNPHKGNLISVTQITGTSCNRKTYLERTLPYYVEPEDKLPTFRGSLIHNLVEQVNGPRLKRAKWVLEEHLELPVKTAAGEWVLSGTLDALDTKRNTIYDIKTLQDYAVTKLVKGQNHGKYSEHIPDAYVIQLNFYRYMLQKLKQIKVKRLRLQIIGFGRLILTGTRVELRNKGDREVYDVPDVPIIPNADLEELIATEGDLWYKILFLGANPPVVKEEYKWLCRICQYYKTELCPDPEAERAQQFNV